GGLVRLAEARGVDLADLTDDELRAGLAAGDDPVARRLATDGDAIADLRAAATIDGALERSDVVGGTAPKRVTAELRAVASRLGVPV
ncbi:MAG TPA: hypothetical protein VET90_05705, partial [Candidatus Binatus sp.]|nr:hypothetical protein [Candidatus Binatus sp.]